MKSTKYKYTFGVSFNLQHKCVTAKILRLIWGLPAAMPAFLFLVVYNIVDTLRREGGSYGARAERGGAPE